MLFQMCSHPGKKNNSVPGLHSALDLWLCQVWENDQPLQSFSMSSWALFCRLENSAEPATMQAV